MQGLLARILRYATAVVVAGTLACSKQQSPQTGRGPTTLPIAPSPPDPTAPMLDTTCASGTLRPTGKDAGYAVFGRFQYDWYASNDDPDYQYYGNHRGGFGDTLEYLGCAGERYVWLQWSWSQFARVAVRSPWSGSTDRGLRIADDLDRFRTLYPAAHPQTAVTFTPAWPPDLDVWDDGALRVALRNGRVYIIQADWYPVGGEPDPNPDTRESTHYVLGPSPQQWN